MATTRPRDPLPSFLRYNNTTYTTFRDQVKPITNKAESISGGTAGDRTEAEEPQFSPVRRVVPQRAGSGWCT